MCAVLNGSKKPLLQTFQEANQLLDLTSRCVDLGKIVEEETKQSAGMFSAVGSVLWAGLAALRVVNQVEEKRSQLDACQQLVRDWKTLVGARMGALISKTVLTERDLEEICPEFFDSVQLRRLTAFFLEVQRQLDVCLYGTP